MDVCSKCGKQHLTGPIDPECKSVNGMPIKINEECYSCANCHMGFCYEINEYLCDVEVTYCILYKKRKEE